MGLLTYERRGGLSGHRLVDGLRDLQIVFAFLVIYLELVVFSDELLQGSEFFETEVSH